MGQAIVTYENKAGLMNIYPVLKGKGASDVVLKPGEYQDFRLEFNCMS